MIDRFFSNVFFVTNGCWFWKGGSHTAGYGIMQDEKKPYLAHRWAYEKLIGPIGGKESHHTCRNKPCVNPDHIKLVTRSEHMVLSGNQYSRQDRCKRGHMFDEANTMIRIRNNRKTRECRICSRARKRRYNSRRKARV